MNTFAIFIYNQAGTLISTCNNLSSVSYHCYGEMRFSVAPSGNCLTGTFRGKNTGLLVEPGFFVIAQIDIVNVFAGVITRCPSLDRNGRGQTRDQSDEADLFECVGMIEDFRNAATTEFFWSEAKGFGLIDVAELMRQLILRADGVSSEITVDAANFPATGVSAGEWFAPERELLGILQETVEQVPNLELGVDADQEVFARVPTGTTSLAYADALKIDRIPLTGADIVTKVRLTISGGDAGDRPTLENYVAFTLPNETVSSRVKQPVVYEYEDAQHSKYGSVRTFGLNEGVNAFVRAQNVSDSNITLQAVTSSGSPPDFKDGDETTYASATAPGVAGNEIWILYEPNLGANPDAENWVGFYFRYVLQAVTPKTVTDYDFLGIGTTARLYVQYDWAPDSGPTRRTYGYWAVPDTEADGGELRAIFPRDARQSDRNDTVYNPGLPGSWDSIRFEFRCLPEDLDTGFTDPLRVIEWYPLQFNTALLDELAGRRIRLPGVTPQAVEFAGRIAPVPNIELTGYPGGDQTFPATNFEYILDRKGYRTRITLDTERENVTEVEALEAIKTLVARAQNPLRLAQQQ